MLVQGLFTADWTTAKITVNNTEINICTLLLCLVYENEQLV
jgi:hypothetical protein